MKEPKMKKNRTKKHILTKVGLSIEA